MDLPEPVSDDTAWRLAAAYIGAWNHRDRDAWLELLHPELEFRPSALVGTAIVYHGIDGAARYFDELIASKRTEQAQIVGLRRLAPDRFVIELKLLIRDRSVANASIISQVRDGRFVDTAGYLSDARSLASAGHILEDAPAVPLRQARSSR
jgi:predicted TIM-barrel fold metal-dependent hydrolase